MSSPEHFAKNMFFGCIDDRLVELHLHFIIEIGGAFYAAVAGGGLAFVDTAERDTAIKQVVASYLINHIDTVYLESHTECGAYRLAGITFTDRRDEITKLYNDLDRAAQLVQEALASAGAKPGEVKILTRVVDPVGIEQPHPQHVHV